MKSNVLILGGDGQDGIILSDKFIRGGYNVISVGRGKKSRFLALNFTNKDLTYKNFTYVTCDISDLGKLEKVLSWASPFIIINCAGVSAGSAMTQKINFHMAQTFYPVQTICNWIIKKNIYCKFVQLSSREIFGLPTTLPINELTPRNPRNNYGISKNLADELIIEYRNKFGTFFCSAIISNHVSYLSKNENSLKKIALFCSNSKKIAGSGKRLKIGSLSTKRSWLSAEDVCLCIFKMCKADHADDYVIGSSISTSIETLLDLSFSYRGLEWQQHVEIDNVLNHTDDDCSFVCDSSKVKKNLNWMPVEDIGIIVPKLINDCERFLA